MQGSNLRPATYMEHMAMNTNQVRKSQTGEPTKNGGEFGSKTNTSPEASLPPERTLEERRAAWMNKFDAIEALREPAPENYNAEQRRGYENATKGHGYELSVVLHPIEHVAAMLQESENLGFSEASRKDNPDYCDALTARVRQLRERFTELA